jgi:hypothetical protein
MNRKTLSIYKLYRIVDSVDTELAGEAYQRYLDKEANAAKIAALAESHLQNSHSEQASQASGDPKFERFSDRAGVVEWQTRRTQNPVGATLCGFKSRLRHQVFQ